MSVTLSFPVCMLYLSSSLFPHFLLIIIIIIIIIIAIIIIIILSLFYLKLDSIFIQVP
jgi:hypothetical protein